MQKPAPTIDKYLEKHPAAAEYRFLFECCRAAFAGTSIRYPDDIRLEVFLEIVQHHKLVPHLYPVLKGHCENVPDAVLKSFRELLNRHNLHILKLSGELVRLSNLFAGQNIPWLSIKGPALSLQLYGDIAARQSGDLDILIAKGDLEKTCKLLKQAEYVPTMDYEKFNTSQTNFIRKYYRDITFRHSTKNICIELHWLLDNDRQSPLNQDFHSIEKNFITMGSQRIPILPFTFNLLYLCLHGNHHGWYRLFWLWDFATIIATATPQQIEQLIFEAQKNGVNKALAQSVVLSHIFFSIPIPGQLAKLPVPLSITRLAIKFIFTKDMMSLKNSPFRVYYKMRIFSIRFFLLYYYRRTITFLLRKYKRTG